MSDKPTMPICVGTEPALAVDREGLYVLKHSPKRGSNEAWTQYVAADLEALGLSHLHGTGRQGRLGVCYRESAAMHLIVKLESLQCMNGWMKGWMVCIRRLQSVAINLTSAFTA